MKATLSLCALLVLFPLVTPRATAEEDFTLEELNRQYFALATEGKDEAKQKKLAEAILKKAAGDADELNEFAWKVLTEENIKKHDLDLGMKAAKAAFDACQGKNAAIVDTYARAFFESGKLDDAITWQKKALEVCDDDNLKSELKETLEKYEKKKSEPKPAEPKP